MCYDILKLKVQYFHIVKKCFEARSSKAATCQAILLDIFPRLAAFLDINFSRPFRNVIETVDHTLALVNKYPEAMVYFKLEN